MPRPEVGDLFAKRLQAILGQVLLDQRPSFLTEVFDAAFRDAVLGELASSSETTRISFSLDRVEIGRGQMIQIREQRP